MRTMKTLWLLSAAGWICAIGIASAQKDSARALYQQAIHEEQALGNVAGAMTLYERVVATSSDRELTARAELRLAGLYQKLGRTEEARTRHEKIVARYQGEASLVDLVKVARAALGEESSSTRASGPVVRRVWAPDFALLAAASPDGQYLTYVDWMSGDLAVRELTSGKSRHLTKKGSWFVSSELALYSTVSPDGKQVAYNWFGPPPGASTIAPTETAADGWVWSLRVIGSDGGDPRILYSNSEVEYVQPTAWSSDSRQILVMLSGRDGTNRIGVVSVPSGALRILKSLDWREPNHMTFSPDGRYIAYDFPQDEDSPNRDVFLLATDGSREIVLAKHPAKDVLLGWVPDSKSLLFASDRTGTMDAWTLQVDDGKPAGDAELVKSDIGRIEPLGFSRKGAFYYGLPTGLEDVYIASFDPATGQVSSPPTPVTHRSVGWNRAPVWSPDGRRLSFSSGVKRTVSGSTPEITSLVIRSIDTGDERELVPKVTRLYGLPRWSPDGRSLIANGYDRKRREGIYFIDVVSGEATPVVHGQRYDPGWSPDGKTIYYRSGQRAIIARDLEDGQERELHRGSVRPGMSVSPDGRYVAFKSIEKGVHLNVVATAGGEARVVADWPENSNPTIAWEPDSRHLFAASRDAFWRVPVEGGAARRLDPVMTGIREIAFSPDGKHVAFTAGASKAEVWVLENFLPKASTKR